MAARSPRIDALRGFAVFGILLVNVWSIVYGFSMNRYGFQEFMPVAEQYVLMFVAGFAEAKFYPIFAFLFGAGFALQTGGLRAEGPVLAAIRRTYDRRLVWLLACGLLHGALIWYGDILSSYAITGFWLAPKAGRRLRELAASLRILVWVNLAIFIVTSLMIVNGGGFDSDMDAVIGAERERAVFTQGGWADIAVERLWDFGENLAGILIFGTRLALLFVLGVFAVRLGWLTRPARARAVWRKVLLIGLAVGLPLNMWWALVVPVQSANPFFQPPGADLAMALLDVAGAFLGAAYVAAFMLVRESAVAWLAPVGKMALTNYLTQSLVLVFVLQGFGLGLGAVMDRAELLALCFGIMAVQLMFCHWWLARHAQGPFEALWRRYTYAGATVRG